MMSLESFVRLGWAFAKVMAGKLRGTRPQLPRFVSQYAPDGMVPFEPGDRDVMDGASRCTLCGACDRFAMVEGTFDLLGADGPMAFVVGVSRHSGEHDMADVPAESEDAKLDAFTAVCPTDVPFTALTALVRRRGAALRAVRT